MSSLFSRSWNGRLLSASCGTLETCELPISYHGDRFFLGLVSVFQGGLQDRVKMLVPAMDRPPVPGRHRADVHNTDGMGRVFVGKLSESLRHSEVRVQAMLIFEDPQGLLHGPCLWKLSAVYAPVERLEFLPVLPGSLLQCNQAVLYGAPRCMGSWFGSTRITQARKQRDAPPRPFTRRRGYIGTVGNEVGLEDDKCKTEEGRNTVVRCTLEFLSVGERRLLGSSVRLPPAPAKKIPAKKAAAPAKAVVSLKLYVPS